MNKQLRDGKLFNPRFVIDEVSKYHIVRTMDLQEANRSAARDWDDIATMERMLFRNNYEWQTGNRLSRSQVCLLRPL